jgi:hypothetical protein
MYHAKVRYGFLTTYHYTIFLKQEQSTDNRWVLWYSNPIGHETSSSDVAPGATDPLAYHGKVSVRECMLFFAHEIQSDNYKATNSMSIWNWVSSNLKKAQEGEDRHIDEPPGGSEASRGSSETGEFQEVSDSQPADDYQSENPRELSLYKSDISDPFGEVRDSQPADDDQYQGEDSSELSSCKSDISDPFDKSTSEPLRRSQRIKRRRLM